jgi:hypothetical protein
VRPDADECLPYDARHIELVSEGDVLDLLERQIADTEALLSKFTPEQEQ